MSDQAYSRELYISWETFEKDSRALAEKLREFPWKGLLAITRGGLAPAALLSRYLDITHVETLCVASYNDRSQTEEMNLIKGVDLDDNGRGWLVVDDLADTGKTLQFVGKMLPEARIATLYVKPAGKDLPDTYLKEFDQSTWIVFPWET